MTKKQTKADINFEQELWKAANELRGAVAENQYKDYVLPLIFLKHLSERYEVRKQQLVESLKDESSDYYTIDTNQLFNGDFIYTNIETEGTEERRIRDGLRNGNTTYFDNNGNKLKKEKYKDGILKD